MKILLNVPYITLLGVIGDWKNHFTEDQNKQFNEDYEKHMADTSLSFYMEP